MIFIGYSSEDRYTVVEPLLFHLRNYGFKVWYDFDNMYLGDSRKQENFEKGIKGANYLIFIITHGFFESSCAKEELEYAHQLVEQCGYIMFTVFYKFLPQELPSRYDWLRNYIFNEIAMDTGTRYAADQIVERIVKDSLSVKRIQSIDDLVYENFDEYTRSLIKELKIIDIRNYGLRVGLLYAIYIYLRKSSTHMADCEKAIAYIVKQSQFQLRNSHLLYSIFEKSILLFVNHLLDD